MLEATLGLLVPQPGDRVLDGTLGLGGHGSALLQAIGPDGVLYGVDRDPEALALARRRLEAQGGRFVLLQETFDRALARDGLPQFDVIFLDLGVSSMQLDTPERGFSFSHPGPLDMRMDPSAGPSAADLVNTATEHELSRIFSAYGEEPHARRVAREIVRCRPFATTSELAACVSRVAGRSNFKVHPATRVFQALRIAVNDELEGLDRALPLAVQHLAPGGRLAILSFHSLEDRRVKQFIRAEAKGCTCPPRLPACVCGRQPRLVDLTSKPILAALDEVAANPRSRSARLRGARRV